MSQLLVSHSPKPNTSLGRPGMKDGASTPLRAQRSGLRKSPRLPSAENGVRLSTPIETACKYSAAKYSFKAL
jgi:hypothetical protein